MTAIALKQETDNYWNLIKDASVEVSAELRKRITEKLNAAKAKAKRQAKKYDVDDFAGGWTDECFMDADELIKVIYEDRKVESNREKQLDALWDE